jgi:hypothetical protein
MRNLQEHIGVFPFWVFTPDIRRSLKYPDERPIEADGFWQIRITQSHAESLNIWSIWRRIKAVDWQQADGFVSVWSELLRDFVRRGATLMLGLKPPRFVRLEIFKRTDVQEPEVAANHLLVDRRHYFRIQNFPMKVGRHLWTSAGYQHWKLELSAIKNYWTYPPTNLSAG